jgi:hypothetical protein
MLALLSTLTSCTGEDPTPGGASSPAAHSQDNSGRPVIITLDKRAAEAFYPAAIVRGGLSMQSGCLMLRHLPAVWSADFSWDGDEQQVVWPTGALAVGEKGVFGGGTHPRRSPKVLLKDTLFSAASAQALTRCMRATGAASWVVLVPSDS